MGWEVTCHETPGFIELVLTDEVTGDQTRTATSRAIALGKELDVTDYLVDASSQTRSASIVDLYYLPTQYHAEGASSSSRVAYVVPESEEMREAAEFYENVCLNRGWILRSFQARDEAISWLTEARA